MRYKPLRSLIYLLLLNITQAPGKSGAPRAKGNKGSGSQETDARAATGPLCNYDVRRADPANDAIFDPQCASCVSRSMYLGIQCWEPTWTKATTCDCTNWDFADCKCKASFSSLSFFIFIFLPILCGVGIFAGKKCLANKMCPMYAWEKEYQVWMKKKRKQREKELAALDEEAESEPETEE